MILTTSSTVYYTVYNYYYYYDVSRSPRPAAWNELVWNGFFSPECSLWQRLKIHRIYWEV